MYDLVNFPDLVNISRVVDTAPHLGWTCREGPGWVGIEGDISSTFPQHPLCPNFNPVSVGIISGAVILNLG